MQQLDQEMRLYVSGKKLILSTKEENMLEGHTLEVQYSKAGSLQRSSVTAIEKQLFLEHGGTENQWETLLRLQILRSKPEKPNIAYYYPPSQDPDPAELSDWSSVEGILEESKRPQLSPLGQIAPCEQMATIVEGYLKKIKLPVEPVE